jgi:hypothetical protein
VTGNWFAELYFALEICFLDSALQNAIVVVKRVNTLPVINQRSHKVSIAVNDRIALLLNLFLMF